MAFCVEMSYEQRVTMASWSLGNRRLAWVAVVAAGTALLLSWPAVGQDKEPAPAVKPGPNGLIVHFGDSFVDAGLRQNLAPKFQAEQTKYFFFGRRMTTLATWAFGHELDELYYGFRPSLFLVTLGANDLVNPQPEGRVALVRRIVGKMRGTPCVWIAIPLWKDAPTAFQDMMRRESAPCRWFDSTAMSAQISRQKDGRHPDAKGGATWADGFWTWLQSQRDPSKGYWALKPSPPGERPTPAASSSALPAGTTK